jgi:hypothetical protein
METKEFQRWTAKRKVELLLQLIRGSGSSWMCVARTTSSSGTSRRGQWSTGDDTPEPEGLPELTAKEVNVTASDV